MLIDIEVTDRPIQLVQITDCHLGKRAGDQLLGLDSDHSLQLLTDLINQQLPAPDLLLATGDISNHGHKSAYTRFRQLSQNVARRAVWLPGNHDDPDMMREALAGGEELSRCVDIGGWRVLMLDSTVPGKVGGRFSAQELLFLRQMLEQAGDRHVLVCLHHHPIAIGCEWLDEQVVENADEFFALLDESKQVRGVLWGHVHQQLDVERRGVMLMSTPSSCIQFAPGSKSFKLDRMNPGYRELRLYPDGRIETSVSRLADVEFAIDYDSAQGY